MVKKNSKKQENIEKEAAALKKNLTKRKLQKEARDKKSANK